MPQRMTHLQTSMPPLGFEPSPTAQQRSYGYRWGKNSGGNRFYKIHISEIKILQSSVCLDCQRVVETLSWTSKLIDLSSNERV
ncbi:hypothetical protein TNCV_4751851 [Trichonephila clavipes]|nr:hypothetical protein TNCV_4751851 [Trichonephila clavipes]